VSQLLDVIDQMDMGYDAQPARIGDFESTWLRSTLHN
jgi:hypothetical protein